MGGFSGLVTNAVTLAKSLTKDLQAVVKLERFIGDDKSYGPTAGRRVYSDPVEYKVILNNRTKFVEAGGDNGVQAFQVSSVQFLDPVVVSIRDRITLPDGTHPQIVSVEGPADENGVFFAPMVLFSWLR